MLIIIGAMLPSSIILPLEDLSLSISSLHSNWQIQALLLTSLLCGAQIGTICSISYLIIGLFYLPIFHGGGSIGYILTPEFGYLIGFIPAAWICGYLAQGKAKANIIDYSIFTFYSLCILHLTGIIYLIFGRLFGLWINNLFDLILINTIIPFPTQLLLCLAISPLSILLSRILIVK